MLLPHGCHVAGGGFTDSPRGRVWRQSCEDAVMAVVARLVTFVDVRDAAAAGHMSASARHEAVLSDGTRVLLLDDRGWSSSFPGGDRDPWSSASVEEMETTARAVVGPDEPFGEHSQEDMEASHWSYLADVLRKQGVVVEATSLRHLEHDVVLAPRVLARLGVGST